MSGEGILAAAPLADDPRPIHTISGRKSVEVALSGDRKIKVLAATDDTGAECFMIFATNQGVVTKVSFTEEAMDAVVHAYVSLLFDAMKSAAPTPKGESHG